jgi:hypothetical protein
VVNSGAVALFTPAATACRRVETPCRAAEVAIIDGWRPQNIVKNGRVRAGECMRARLMMGGSGGRSESRVASEGGCVCRKEVEISGNEKKRNGGTGAASANRLSALRTCPDLEFGGWSKLPAKSRGMSSPTPVRHGFGLRDSDSPILHSSSNSRLCERNRSRGRSPMPCVFE